MTTKKSAAAEIDTSSTDQADSFWSQVGPVVFLALSPKLPDHGKLM
jgi:hypothetical protein